MSVYVWGSNQYQQLIGQNGLHCYAPAMAADQFDGQTPVQVATGDGHTLVLCDSGEIYSFGKGREGQLGHDCEIKKDNGKKAAKVGTVEPRSRLVAGLEHETIVGIAAGGLTSYAITSAGEVYHWGLIHLQVNDHYNQTNTSSGMVQAGQLTGLAQDQNVSVAVDREARGFSKRVAPEARALRDIVRDSTERWMMPTDDNDREYYEELRAMGYQNEEVEERMQSRGKEYHGMLAMGCKRHVQTVPRLVANLEAIRIVAISAGYAHVMLLSDQGQLYGAGYNDRGQLGLGHRINTSEFKHVDFLAQKFVLQVVCGQQHTLCRAVDNAGADSSEVFVGSSVGADVFVWGNGMLGQLGIGLRGTSKGRLLPTLSTPLHVLYPLGVVDVAAGANFSAVVTVDGSVYSFGHAEYNQHGTGNKANNDYTDPYFYFEPRPVDYFNHRCEEKKGSSAIEKESRRLRALAHSAADGKPRMKSLSCGANFTVGIDELGNLYSWGWNESGVLGHGFNHFSSSPSQITAIGRGFDGCKVLSVVAGSKHVVALSQAQGNPWALTFRSMLETAPYADCVLTIATGAISTSFPCHRAVLSCRSKYFAGFVRAAERAQEEECLYSQLATQNGEGGGWSAAEPLRLTLTSSFANATTVKSLLEYIYLDRVHLPHHRRRELLHLAADLGVSRLVAALETDVMVEVTAPTGPENVTVTASGYSPSYFVQDMGALIDCQAFSDIVFVQPRFSVPVPACATGEDEGDDEQIDVKSESGEVTVSEGLPEFKPSDYSFVMFAHRAVVSRIAYFEAIAAGHFAESANHMLLREGDSCRKVLVVDISGLQTVDGIDLETFRSVVSYAYTGRLANEDLSAMSVAALEEEETVGMDLVMGALIAANRLGFAVLTQHCERILSLHLGEFFPHNAENCLSFAAAYNIPRLERQCLKVLRRSAAAAGDSGAASGATADGLHEKA